MQSSQSFPYALANVWLSKVHLPLSLQDTCNAWLGAED